MEDGRSPLPRDVTPPPRRQMLAPDDPARRILLGPCGIRAGWSVLLFFVVGLLLQGLFVAISRPLKMAVDAALGTNLFFFEIVTLLATLAATALMARIEKRSLWSYGLSGRHRGLRFLTGALWGMGALSIMLALMHLTGHFFITGFAEDRGRAIHYGLLWLLLFFMVGMQEETSTRGYLQFTLARGLGYWPGALLLMGLFGFGHLLNPGENWFGAVMAGSFGLLLSFTLKRTGSLWWAIGFHTAWDFGQSFVYAVPDSGIRIPGGLFNSSFSGPAWITGGTVGPEGSYFIIPLLLAVAGLFALCYPKSALSESDFCRPVAGTPSTATPGPSEVPSPS